MTKNDLYAYLIREGVNRGYEVIPEFVVDLPEGKTKKVDLVWATRNGDHQGTQNQRNHAYWDLKAIFEIEGSNVPETPQFARHVESFPLIAIDYGHDVERYVILYTDAFDRKHWPQNRDWTQKIQERIQWGGSVVRVIDGRRIREVLKTAEPHQPGEHDEHGRDGRHLHADAGGQQR